MTQITATLSEGMVVTLSNGRHEWTADERLAQIASRCPVHKTLAHGIIIEDNATFGTGQ